MAESAGKCAGSAEAEPEQKLDRLVSAPPTVPRPRLELTREQTARASTPQGAAESPEPEQREVTSMARVRVEQTATVRLVKIRGAAVAAQSPLLDAVLKPDGK